MCDGHQDGRLRSQFAADKVPTTTLGREVCKHKIRRKHYESCSALVGLWLSKRFGTCTDSRPTSEAGGHLLRPTETGISCLQ